MDTLLEMDDSHIEAPLTELCEVVLGIRLFHKHSHLSSEDLVDYHLLCENDATSLHGQIAAAINNTARAVNALEITLVNAVNKDPAALLSSLSPKRGSRRSGSAVISTAGTSTRATTTNTTGSGTAAAAASSSSSSRRHFCYTSNWWNGCYCETES